MNDMFSYIFEFCHSIFKHLDDKFSYNILTTKLSVWVKIKYEQEEFTYNYAPVDYLEWGRLNKRMLYRDFIGDISQILQQIEHIKLD